MAVLNILEFPDKRLRTVAKEVETVDSASKHWSKICLTPCTRRKALAWPQAKSTCMNA